MSSRALRVLAWVGVSACLLAAPPPAEAQIYAVRDENGVLTLSDKPLGAGATTYAVRGATTSSVRTTAPFATIIVSAMRASTRSRNVSPLVPSTIA